MPPLPSAVYVGLLPSLCPPEQLLGSCAVVVDILRATTTICRAMQAGARAIWPCLEIEQARELAARLPGRPLLMGERGGLPIDGFDLDNSPGQCTPQRVKDRDLVMTTTNGTRGIEHGRLANRVLIGSFNNFAAVLQALAGDSRIAIVCAGTDGAITRDDTLFAGALCSALRHRGHSLSNDQALIAEAAWDQVSKDPLAAVLRDTHGGRNLIRLGMESDIDESARWDCVALAPELQLQQGAILAGKS